MIIWVIPVVVSCATRVFARYRLLGHLLPKSRRGIFNVRNDRSAYCEHGGETGPDECALVLTREN